MTAVHELLSDPDFVSEIPIERISKGVDDRGRTTVETVMDQIDASVQPATPRERETLAEADRVKETIGVWTIAALTEDSRIHWSGATYRVASVEKWTDPDGDYYHALAVREGVA